MKRTLLALSTLLISYSGFSQRYDPSADLEPSTFTMGLTYTPSINYRTYGLTDQANSLQEAIKVNSDSLNGASFINNFGLSFVFDLSRSFSLEIGANMGDRGYRTSKQDRPFEVITLRKYKQKYSYINVPVKARIYLNQGPTQLFVTFGASAGIMSTAKYISIHNTDEQKMKTITRYQDESLNRFNVSAIAGFGFRTYVGKRGMLSFEPSFNRSLLSVNKDDVVKIKLYQVGLSVGYSIEITR
jgi:hypothetical protein